MNSRTFPKMGILAAAVFLLAACSVSSPASLFSPWPTVTPVFTPTSLPSPTETMPPVTPTSTPVVSPPISPSNLQNLVSLYQWNLASDIVKLTGIAVSPLADKLAWIAVRYPQAYSLELHEAQTGVLLWQQTLDAKADYPAVAFSPDGSLVASGTGSGNITVWHVSDGSFSQTLKGASYAVRTIVFSPDGNLIAAAGSDSRIYVWRVADGTLQTSYASKYNIGSLLFSPNSRYLAASSDVFAVYDLASKRTSPAIYNEGIAPHPTSEMVFSPDGQFLIVEGELNDAGHDVWIPRIVVWRLSSNRDSVRKVLLPNPIQNMVVFSDGQTVLGYDPTTEQLEVVDTPGKSIVGTVKIGELLFMEYSADLSRFITVTKTSVAVWGVSP